MSDEYLWNRTGNADPDELMLEELLPRIKDSTTRSTHVRAVRAASPASSVARHRSAWMMAVAGSLLIFVLGLVVGMSLRAPSAAPLADIENESGDQASRPATKLALESPAAASASQVEVDTILPVPRQPKPSPSASPVASTKTSAALTASTPPSTLSPKEIREVISRHQGELRRSCWVSSIPDAERKSASVRVSLTIVVSSDGRVSAAHASSAPKVYAEVGRCVAAQARAWKFPESSTSTTLSVPLVFAHN